MVLQVVVPNKKLVRAVPGQRNRLMSAQADSSSPHLDQKVANRRREHVGELFR